jgi:hypothetical protein
LFGETYSTLSYPQTPLDDLLTELLTDPSSCSSCEDYSTLLGSIDQVEFDALSSTFDEDFEVDFSSIASVPGSSPPPPFESLDSPRSSPPSVLSVEPVVEDPLFAYLPMTLQLTDCGSVDLSANDHITKTKHKLCLMTPFVNEAITIHQSVYYKSQRKKPQPSSSYAVSLQVVGHSQSIGGKEAFCRVSYPEKVKELRSPAFHVVMDFTDKGRDIAFYAVLYHEDIPFAKSNIIGPFTIIPKGGKKKRKQASQSSDSYSSVSLSKKLKQDFRRLSISYGSMAGHLIALFWLLIMVLRDF